MIRFFLVLLVALPLAGCFGSGDEPLVVKEIVPVYPEIDATLFEPEEPAPYPPRPVSAGDLYRTSETRGTQLLLCNADKELIWNLLQPPPSEACSDGSVDCK